MYRIGRFFFFCCLCIYITACLKTRRFALPVESITDANDFSAHTANVNLLLNAGFGVWYNARGKNYMEPGSATNNSVWATGNAGFDKGMAFSNPNLKTEDMPTQPTESCDGNGKAALLTTRKVPLGAIVGKGIAAGSLFTGSFYIDPQAGLIPTDEQIRPKLGVPYNGMPIAFSFKYKYVPGNELQDGSGKTLSGKDSMDAYIVLENRNTQPTTRLAVGWFRSGIQTEVCTEQRVDIHYAHSGDAPKGIRNYAKKALKYGSDGNTSLKANEQKDALWGDTAMIKPTHIIIVFASSYQGDDFIGAPESALTIDAFKLIYKNH